MKPALTLEQLALCGFNYSNLHCAVVVCNFNTILRENWAR